MKINEGYYENFRINISEKTTNISKFKDVFKNNSVHEFARFAGAYCVTVNLHNYDFDKLVIPCSEMFRFYFATSQSLTEKIIFGEVQKFTNKNIVNDLVMFIDQKTNEERTKIIDDKLFITLRKSIPDSDAWTLSRIIGEDIAFKEACNIHKTLSFAQMKGYTLYLKMGFPFNGETNLKVQGKIISLDNKKKAFLAFRLLHCTKEFPFENIIVDREIIKGLGKDEQGDKEITWNNKKAEKDKNSKITSSIESDKSIEAELPTIQENRFEFLKDKDLIREEKTISMYRQKKSTKEITKVYEQSSSSGEYNKSNVQPIRPRIENDKIYKTIPAYFEKIILALKILGNRYDFKCNVCDLDNFTYSDQLKLSTFEIKGRIKSNAWVYIDKKIKRVRKYLLIEIKCNDNYIYLLELERESNNYGIYFLTRNDNMFGRIGLSELKSLMYLWGKTSSYRGNRDGLKSKNWILNSINHIEVEGEKKLSNRIKNFIETLL